MAEERNKVADMQGEGFTAFVLFSSYFVLLLYFILRSSYFIQHQDVECNGSAVRFNTEGAENIYLCASGVFLQLVQKTQSCVIAN